VKHAVLLLVLLAGCPLPPPGPVPGPDDGADAAPSPPSSGDECTDAWHRISDLQCKVTVPRNSTWTEACQAGRSNAIDYHTQCVIGAADCATVRACLGEP